MIFAIWVIVNGIVGLALGFWHRNLMVRLHAKHPEVWSQLGGWFFPGDEWSSSLRQPFLSWKSLFFFVTGKYEGLDDRPFCVSAARFRVAILLWLIEFFVGAAMFGV